MISMLRGCEAVAGTPFDVTEVTLVSLRSGMDRYCGVDWKVRAAYGVQGG